MSRDQRSARRARGGTIDDRMPGPQKTSTTLLLRLLIEDKARWDKFARRKRRPLSELIRESFERTIAEERGERVRKRGD